MDDEFYEENTVLDVLHDIMESDRTFFNGVRFLGGQSRDALISMHMRNTNIALNTLRDQMRAAPPAATTTRMVLNFPLDVSGNAAFFDPVPIAPTRTQIDAGVDRHVGVTETVCSICQENVTCATRIRGCGHCFHDQCIQQWFTMNPRCPMCRHDVREAPPPRREFVWSTTPHQGQTLSTLLNTSINDLRDVSGIQIDESHRVHTDEE
jgi:hypothetical protein